MTCFFGLNIYFQSNKGVINRKLLSNDGATKFSSNVVIKKKFLDAPPLLAGYEMYNKYIYTYI